MLGEGTPALDSGDGPPEDITNQDNALAQLIFSFLDKSHTGFIEVSQLKELLADAEFQKPQQSSGSFSVVDEPPPSFPPDELVAFLQDLDRDGTTRLTLEELVQVCLRKLLELLLTFIL